MPVAIVKLGSPRGSKEGLRIGTVRRPPRGVQKTEYAKQNFYDVWLPNISPSADLVSQARASEDEKSWSKFKRAYRAEMNEPDAARVIDLLAALSHHTNFAVGCYCDDESKCHRSVLKELLPNEERSYLEKCIYQFSYFVYSKPISFSLNPSCLALVRSLRTCCVDPASSKGGDQCRQFFLLEPRQKANSSSSPL